MYKLRLWNGLEKEFFVKIAEQSHDNAWCLTSSLKEASELTIDWIQKNLGLIYAAENPEIIEILQVREHAG
jgi:hypothetical protein